MNDLNKIVSDLIVEGEAANAHFQIWLVLRNKALPKYRHVLEDCALNEFFLATSSSHFKMTFISLSKIFDKNRRTSSIESLIKVLKNNGNEQLISEIKNKQSELQDIISRVQGVRHQTVAHNQASVSEEEVFHINELRLQELKDLVSSTCELINEISSDLGNNRAIITSRNRYEVSTLAMLEKLSSLC